VTANLVVKIVALFVVAISPLAIFTLGVLACGALHHCSRVLIRALTDWHVARFVLLLSVQSSGILGHWLLLRQGSLSGRRPVLLGRECTIRIGAIGIIATRALGSIRPLRWVFWWSWYRIFGITLSLKAVDVSPRVLLHLLVITRVRGRIRFTEVCHFPLA